ncbi:hypothetical protein AX17_001419 [Amanita inopinata Kibby_2008]|nr:hypothetical protein AX17_001419 [Amanita inopinata Kibby_2008]
MQSTLHYYRARMKSVYNITDGRCYNERAAAPPSLFQNGNLVIQAHHVGWLVSGFFTLIATITSAWLINKHLHWYTNKREQRYIVRILFLVPIYAIISLASYLFWNHSTPLLLIRDGYESTVLTAFFYLLLTYLSFDPDEQKEIFVKFGLSREADQEAIKHGESVKKWIFPLGFVTWKPRDGLYFLQLMKWGILQYCIIRPVTTLVAVILDYVGLYCEGSWGLGWGHIYITVIVSISVSVAMYCLIQFYVPVSKLLAPHQPLLKLFCIKAVVFLTFWQATLLSLLVLIGVVKDTKYMTAEDINIGIGALLETFEMTLFAFLHIKAFSYKPYKSYCLPGSKDTAPQSTSRLHALGHAMDFRETCKEIWAGCIYFVDKARGREPTPDHGARRAAYYENAFARRRPRQKLKKAGEKGALQSLARKPKEKVTLPSLPLHVQVDREVNMEGERQWLGTGNDYVYGLEFMRRERSDSLGTQIERELQRRGYTPLSATREQRLPEPTLNAPASIDTVRHAKHPSWWRNIYNRVSQTDSDPEEQSSSPSPARRKDRSKNRSRSRRHLRSSEDSLYLLSNYPTNLDDLPPRSVLGTYQRQQNGERNGHSRRATEVDHDVLMPLPVFQDVRNVIPGSSSRSLPRQGFSAALNDRESIPSRLEAKNTIPTAEVNIIPASPRYSRADSLLGRLFPESMTEGDSMTEFGATSDGAQSIFSLSSDGIRQAKLTPRARLTIATPQIIAGSAADSSGRRVLPQSHSVPDQIQPPHELPAASAAEVLVPNQGSSPEERHNHAQKRRPNAHRPLPTPPPLGQLLDSELFKAPDTLPPLSNPNIGLNAPANDCKNGETSQPESPRKAHDLRRSNAQVRPREDVWKRSEPQTLLPGPRLPSRLQIPEESHPRQDSSGRSPNVLLKPTASSRVMTSMSRDVGYQTRFDIDNRNPQSSSRHPHASGSGPVYPSGHKIENPPVQRPQQNVSYATKQGNTANRLRKHQEGRHTRSPASSHDMPAPSSTSPAVQHPSRPPDNGNGNDATAYSPRNWRTVDYQSTSWYLPASS